MQNTIDANDFYKEYYGHQISHLRILFDGLKKQNDSKKFIYLAGDSSLDNKHWLFVDKKEKAINGYEHILKPPLMKPDVAYHMNKLLVNSDYYVLNTAIEESTLADRSNKLLAQDNFIKENITNDDILFVSVGGNDIALMPSFRTIGNILLMMYINNITSIKKGPDVCWGMKYFINLFKNDVQKYILNIIGNKRPKKIIISMIYYPDEKSSGGWADTTLNYLGYNSNPKKLQAAIKTIHKFATSKINIEGSEVIPFPMFEVLNGKISEDYVQRVEPSNIGGEKLAFSLVSKYLL